MKKKRVEKVNSLLKKVISEVVTKEVKNPHVAPLVTVTQVSVTADLRQAKVFISIIGKDEEKQGTIEALNSAAGFISCQASKKVELRYFPSLTFHLDTSVDKHIRIAEILHKIHSEKTPSDDPPSE